jgi:hypothetical protein
MSDHEEQEIKFIALPAQPERERAGVSDGLYRDMPIDYDITGERRVIKQEPRQPFFRTSENVTEEPRVKRFVPGASKK